MSVSRMVGIRSAVRNHLERIPAGENVIVACSGGADSLALAYSIAKEAPVFALSLIGVTVDHQLQDRSRAQAERVLRQLADSGIANPEILTVTVLATDGMEASARRARYEALSMASQRFGAAKVFLGHTRDDQAESVLLGIARGSGTRSLSGMAPDIGIYRRPLLGITRQETESACQEVGLEAWHDPHNVDLRFRRVRARSRVLPLMEEELGPGISAALARSASLLRDDADALDEWAEREFEGMDWRSLDCQALADLPRAVRTRVIRLALYRAGAPTGSISADHVVGVEALVSTWHGQGSLDLPGGVKVVRLSGRLSLSPPKV
jgi:tRNA(Ile)-lysidine synthase